MSDNITETNCWYCGKGDHISADCPTGRIPERTYTAEELRLNQATLLREAANEADIIERVALALGSRDKAFGANCVGVSIRAIPTDQLALDRHDAELRDSLPQCHPAACRDEMVWRKAMVDFVQQAVLAEAEWWADRFSWELSQGLSPLAKERLAAYRAAAGAQEEKK